MTKKEKGASPDQAAPQVTTTDLDYTAPVLGAALTAALQVDCGHAAAEIIADGLVEAFASTHDLHSTAHIIAIELLPLIRQDLFDRGMQ